MWNKALAECQAGPVIGGPDIACSGGEAVTSPSSAPASSASALRLISPRPDSEVTVIDRTGICEETSSGNAGAFAFSDVLPLAHKGMLRNVPQWLADPLGPLAIPPAYLPKLAALAVPLLARRQ